MGAINVDACRIPFQNEEPTKTYGKRNGTGTSLEWSKYKSPEDFKGEIHQKGRFPANLLVSDKALDTGEKTISRWGKHKGKDATSIFNMGTNGNGIAERVNRFIGDVGGQSRFFDLDAWARHHGFLDVPKASKSERDKGLQNIEPKRKYYCDNRPQSLECFGSDKRKGKEDFGKQLRKNIHPTVKPIKLMAYLIELGCPRQGIVLDPFVGSGTTCIAAERLRRKWIGIDINPDYVKIAQKRLNAEPTKLSKFMCG